jgi:hypothetical protein
MGQSPIAVMLTEQCGDDCAAAEETSTSPGAVENINLHALAFADLADQALGKIDVEYRTVGAVLEQAVRSPALGPFFAYSALRPLLVAQ